MQTVQITIYSSSGVRERERERKRERETQTDRQTDRQRECIVSFSMSGQFLEDRVYLNISPVCYTTTQEPLVPFHDIHQQSGTQIYESLRRRDLEIWLFLQFYTHSHTDTLIMSHLILCKLHTLLTGELLHRQETNCCQPLKYPCVTPSPLLPWDTTHSQTLASLGHNDRRGEPVI